MTKLIKKYSLLTKEEKLSYTTLVSITFNIVLALAKFILAFFYGIFFLVSGIINVCLSIGKIQCYLGLKKKNKRSFQYRNNLCAIFLGLAAIQYSIYMCALLVGDRSVTDYSAFLAINIAFVSFVELGFNIYGLATLKDKGHYYRNLKIINFCSSLTSIVLTQVALLSFMKSSRADFYNGLSGLIVSGIILLLALYIFIAPKYSILDKEHQVYKLIKKEKLPYQENDKIEIILLKSFVYGDFIYKGTYNQGFIDGYLNKTKGKLSTLNIFVKIILIILSEILIFVYGFGALIYYFKTFKLFSKLDKEMGKNGFVKVENS